MSRRGEGEIRTSRTGKTERRGDEIMGNWSRESGMKSGEEKREAGCPTLKQCRYDSCLRPNLGPTNSTDKCLWLYQPSH